MILKFKDSDTRERFLQIVDGENPSIAPFLRKALSRPDIVVKLKDVTQLKWLESRVSSLAEIFPNIRLDLMASPQAAVR